MNDRLWKDAQVVGEEVVRFRGVAQRGVHGGVARGPTQSSRRMLGSHAKYFQLITDAVGANEGNLGEP